MEGRFWVIFGKTPLPPNPEVVKLASEQLKLSVFEGDPLEAAPNNIETAKKALKERNLTVTEKNIFLVLAAMVPGKKMELNEGIRFLTGTANVDIPLKIKGESRAETPVIPVAPSAPVVTGPVTTRCTVTEQNVTRVFTVTVEPLSSSGTAIPLPAEPVETTPAIVLAAPPAGTPVHSAFAGSVEVADILVKVGDNVTKGKVVAKVEAMKAQHDILAPCDGKVTAIHVKIGDEVDQTKALMTIS